MPVALSCSYLTPGMRIRLVLPAEHLEDIVRQHRFVGIRTGELPLGVIFALLARVKWAVTTFSTDRVMDAAGLQEG